MAQDDPVPGSSWIGSNFYGEKIPTVRPKKKLTGKNAYPGVQSSQMGAAQQRAGIKELRHPTDPNVKKLNSDARRKAIAMWQNRQST